MAKEATFQAPVTVDPVLATKAELLRATLDFEDDVIVIEYVLRSAEGNVVARRVERIRASEVANVKTYLDNQATMMVTRLAAKLGVTFVP